MASPLPALRKAAPRLTWRLFDCSQQPLTPQRVIQSRKVITSSQKFWKPKIQVKSPSRLISGFAQDAGTFSERSSPLGSLGRSFQSPEPQAGHFPERSSRSVAYWLLGSAASVFGLVVFGGLTRLTESGYSDTQI